MCTIQKEDLICMITNQYFYDPVTISDGNVYEKDAITEWLKKNNTSPKTRELIEDTTMFPSNIVANIVKQFMEEHPEKKIDQYSPSFNHEDNVIKINKLLKKIYENLDYYNNPTQTAREYMAQLLKYNNFKTILFHKKMYEIKYMNYNQLALIVSKCYFQVAKHIIDNIVDFDYRDKYNWTAIHYICKYGEPEIIEYTINKKGIDLESKSKSGYQPIHLICAHQNYDTIVKILEKDIDKSSIVNKFKNEKNVGIKELIILNDNISITNKIKLIEYISDK